MLLYDADCRFCRFCVRAVDRLDRHERLALLGFRDERATPLLTGVPEEVRYASWHLAQPDGTVVSAGAAFRPLLERLAPRARWLAPLLGAAYPLVARRRGLLGRLVPDGPAPARFP